MQVEDDHRILGIEPPATGVEPRARSSSPSSLRAEITGRGLPKPHGCRGDLPAQLRIVTPSVLSEREKQLYNKRARAFSFEPRGHFSS